MTKGRRIEINVDGVEVSVPRKNTRSTRNGGKPQIPEKFIAQRTVEPLVAKTTAQKNYIRSMAENTISIASGHAGCGKTFCAAYRAAEMLMRNEIDTIIITRPYAHLGKDYGATPGTDFEKLEPFCRPILDVIKKIVGGEKYKYYIENKVIEIAPLEKIQGRSFDDPCVIIADECQNASKPQLLSLVTRLGEDVKFLAICGDPRQSISSGENALDWIAGFFERNKIAKVGVTHFTEEDCVRSGIVKDILIAFEREGGFYNNIKD